MDFILKDSYDKFVPNIATPYLAKIKLPDPHSHKGQNGKLLIIGGSELFHAASRWSLDIASKLTDMVFYASTPQNNRLIQEAKANFWNGIVVPQGEVETYVREADCILIGPGMTRSEETKRQVNYLLAKYSYKKWVVDAGALQMVDPTLLNKNCIITPHEKELMRVNFNLSRQAHEHHRLRLDSGFSSTAKLQTSSLYRKAFGKYKPVFHLFDLGVTILLKGRVDKILWENEMIKIKGGNAGMTKGGTGDVLAGLVAALYCQYDALTSAVVGSYINKRAGDALYEYVGPYFNASDLVEVIPEVLWGEVSKVQRD